MKDILIDNRYRVDYKIGQGGFGLVYAGIDLESSQEVAIKLMVAKEGPWAFRNETHTYAALAGGIGIPRVIWAGDECEYHVMIHDLLGPNLEDLFNYCGRRLSLKTTLLVADQAIARIKYMHDKGYVHRDIKPDNFLMGVGRQGNVLYAIDFGLATELREEARRSSLEGGPFGGTSRYASVNAHTGRELSWGDDLECLGYSLLYFLKGSLPWQGLKPLNGEEKNEMLKERKMRLAGEEAYLEGLPVEFMTCISYARSLAFNEKPDYAYLQQLFCRLFKSRGYEHDNVFDWTVKRFYEMHGRDGGEPTTSAASKKSEDGPAEEEEEETDMMSTG